MSPHPSAGFLQCLCNKNPFRPVWGNVPETNKGPANPFICCWMEPGEEAYSSNPTFLFDSEVLFTSFTCSSFPGFILAEQKDQEEKKFTILDNLYAFEKWPRISLLNQMYSSAGFFWRCFRGSLFVSSYLSLMQKLRFDERWIPRSTPHILQGVNNAFGVIYLK